MIICNPDKRIRYIGGIHEGKKHDFSLLKEEFSDKECFENFHLKVDSGYQGIANQFVCKQIDIPLKKPPKKELSLEQKEHNRQLAKERITVEHCFAGMKNFHILRNRLRLKSIQLYENIVCICASLWNFCLDNPCSSKKS
jgi:hypothetical protein